VPALQPLDTTNTTTLFSLHLITYPTFQLKMETVNNLASQASKLIWGEQNTTQENQNETAGKEPISGEQGKGTVNDPYDQGNSGKKAAITCSSQSCLLGYYA
jgi:hypothetical protein